MSEPFNLKSAAGPDWPEDDLAEPATAPRDWLEGGLAILDSTGTIREISEPLADWLDGTPVELVGREFWTLLKSRCAGQTEEIDAIRRGDEALRERVLRWIEDGDVEGKHSAAGALRLEVAEQGGSVFVRLGSVLPGLVELEEGDGSDYPLRESVQRQLWARLARSEAQLKLLSEQWPGVIFSQRADFSFRFISPRIEELTGIPAPEWGRRPDLFWQVVDESDAAELRGQLARARTLREPLAGTYRLRHAQTGRMIYVLEHRRLNLSPGGLVLGYEGVWLDVTRQTLTERRLSSAAWKETLSVLTTSLAHDFGNVMAGIHALVESVLDQPAANPELAEGLKLVQQNSRQASQLVRRIIDLHQGRTGECYYHDLNEVAADLADLIQKIIPRRMRFSLERGPRPLPVYLDVVELRQVVIGLVMNAVEAMKPDGRMVLRADSFLEPLRAERQAGAILRWPAVGLSIRDDGAGISPEQLPRVFEPFFTTKPGNKGTGLGLYNARVFVERHAGLIAVRSAHLSGSEFSLMFPEADFAESAAVGPIPPAMASGAGPGARVGTPGGRGPQP